MGAAGRDRPGGGRVGLFEQFESRDIRVFVVGCPNLVNGRRYFGRGGRHVHIDNGRQNRARYQHSVENGWTPNDGDKYYSLPPR